MTRPIIGSARRLSDRFSPSPAVTGPGHCSKASPSDRASTLCADPRAPLPVPRGLRCSPDSAPGRPWSSPLTPAGRAASPDESPSRDCPPAVPMLPRRSRCDDRCGSLPAPGFRVLAVLVVLAPRPSSLCGPLPALSLTVGGTAELPNHLRRRPGWPGRPGSPQAQRRLNESGTIGAAEARLAFGTPGHSGAI